MHAFERAPAAALLCGSATCALHSRATWPTLPPTRAYVPTQLPLPPKLSEKLIQLIWPAAVLMGLATRKLPAVLKLAQMGRDAHASHSAVTLPLNADELAARSSAEEGRIMLFWFQSCLG